MKNEEYEECIRVTRDHIGKIPLPSLGDSTQTYAAKLTEPEVNAIHFAMGFIRSACRDLPEFKRIWAHYGPTLELLSGRLYQETELDKESKPNQGYPEDTLKLELFQQRNTAEFKTELEKLINKFSMDDLPKTPDYLLADFLITCLLSYSETVKAREVCYGRNV